MRPLVMTPGSTCSAASLWPLQQHEHPDRYIGLDYKRGRKAVDNTRYVENPRHPVLVIEAARVLRSWLATAHENAYASIDVLGHSRGAVVVYHAVQLYARKVKAGLLPDGLINKVALVCPGVIGGPVLVGGRHYYFSTPIVYKLAFGQLMSSPEHDRAIVDIQHTLPDFMYRIKDSTPGMLESVHGAVSVQNDFPVSKIRIFAAEHDEIIPLFVTKKVARRTNIDAYIVSDVGHDIPLLDTKGVVLEEIGRWLHE